MSKALIAFQEARARILAHARALEPVSLPLAEINGYVTAEDAVARYDLPMFDNSAMDGYGVRVTDVAGASPENPASLKCQATVQAGEAMSQPLEAGHAIRIFTGAPVPPGVEAVVMQEDCQFQDGRVAIRRAARAGDHIRKRGEEFQKGVCVLAAGARITPPVVGLLATLGYAAFPVVRKPRVALVGTGNELVAPGEPLAPGQIYDSNTYALRAALADIGITDCRVFHARDTLENTLAQFRQALAGSDVVITLGGVSVGEFDFVKTAVERFGIETVFWRIAIKPGKPVYFGVYEATDPPALVFGLPGNPVSALVTFYQLVRPALLRMMGLPESSDDHLPRKAYLTQTLKKKAGRLDFVRGRLLRQADGWTVAPTQGQDSHMLGGLATADCLIVLPQEEEAFEVGCEITVEPLVWRS